MVNVKFTTNVEKVKETTRYFLLNDLEVLTEEKEIILKEHPKLNALAKERRADEINNYVDKFYKKNIEKIRKSKSAQETLWKKTEKQVDAALSEILNTDPAGLEKIEGVVGIAAIYPRDLRKLTFQTYYLQYPYDAASVILHEITHFVYTKKWLEMFSKDTLETLDIPHPYWYLSEIIVPIINSEDSLRVLIPHAETRGFKEFDRPSDEVNEDNSIFGHFLKKYLKFKEEGKSVEDFFAFSRSEIDKFYK